MPRSGNLEPGSRFVRHGQFFPAFGAAGGQHAASVGRRHPFPETMLVYSLALRGLKSPFHGFILFYSFISFVVSAVLPAVKETDCGVQIYDVFLFCKNFPENNSIIAIYNGTGAGAIASSGEVGSEFADSEKTLIFALRRVGNPAIPVQWPSG